jgi:hypothetical protein
MDENKWYDLVKLAKRSEPLFWFCVITDFPFSDNKHSKDAEYHNDHCLSVAESFVALLSPESPDSAEKSKSTEETYTNHLHQPCKYCQYCWAISIRYCALQTDDEAAYHMRAK